MITEYSSGLNAGSRPWGITAGSDGDLWFGDQGTTKAIGQITTAGSISEVGGLGSGSVPYGLASGTDGNIWFADEA